MVQPARNGPSSAGRTSTRVAATTVAVAVAIPRPCNRVRVRAAVAARVGFGGSGSAPVLDETNSVYAAAGADDEHYPRPSGIDAAERDGYLYVATESGTGNVDVSFYW